MQFFEGNQFYIFFVFFLIGVVFGFPFFFILKIKNKYVRAVLEVVLSIASVGAFFLLSLDITNGITRFYMLLATIFGFFASYKIFANVFAKGLLICYNSFIKLILKLKPKLLNALIKLKLIEKIKQGEANETKSPRFKT